jgi:Secretion system C-terminal sorting domain/Outer membrane protein SusF_SusE
MQLRLLFSTLLLALSFTGFSQSLSVGIIGSATPNGWASDTNLVQSPDSAHLWSLELPLTEGECKFRTNDDWAVNWGFMEFPYGVGVQGGPNIPIPAAGIFTVKFNSNTGAYSFSVRSDIGIIGNATPLGWGEDTNLFPDPIDSALYSITLRLVMGEAKFRSNDDWAVNWGAADFPTGIGVQNGPNIPIPATGKYEIDFNKVTGEYTFTEVLEYNSIGLIGSATPGGWDTDTNLVKDSGNPDLWKGTFTLTDGEAKFRSNDSWAVSWGDTLFPSGIGIVNGLNIPVVAGEYLVSFNTATAAYNFLVIGNYSTVGIIGDATPGGWLGDTPMEQDPNDKSLWKLRVILTDGALKFRANNDWAINWGNGSFPTGTGIQDGADIPIPAGEYVIRFNSTTGEYSFELLVIYSTVGLIGPATPNANWDTDVDMTKDSQDESFWFINTIDLSDGEAKFRAEDAWTVNWGLAQFPSGVGTQNGPNIPITGGTYKVTLNSATGEYAFTEPSSTVDLLRNDAIKFVPNPASDVVNIQVSAAELQGEATVAIFNQLGTQVLTQTLNIQNSAKLNIAGLSAGTYLVHLSNGKVMVGKNLVIVK